MENQLTGERIANLLTAKGIDFHQKKMFGGVCFMVDDKMLMGTFKGGIMARVNPTEAESLIESKGASQMMQANRPMVGYLMVEPDGYETDTELAFWMDICLAFNPLAKSSKKK